jgi:isoquinoline 1-oxidoreductase subunit beta
VLVCNQSHSQVTLRDHAALWVEITPGDGRVERHSFHSYRILRNSYQMLHMNETPEIEVHLDKSTEQPGSSDEPSRAAVFPSITNVTFAAS